MDCSRELIYRKRFCMQPSKVYKKPQIVKPT